VESNNIYTAAPASNEFDGLLASEPEHIRSADELAAIPDELKQRKQWMNWKIGPIKEDGKFKKLPMDPDTSFTIDDKLPGHWQTFEETVALYIAGKGDGIAYCFSESDPFTGIDLDGCRDPETGDISPAAAEIIATIFSYWEISPSEAGMKGICRAVLPAGYSSSGTLPDGTGIEVYDRQRMFALTGAVLDGYEHIVEAQDAINEICTRHIRKKTLELVSRDAVPPELPAPDFDVALIAELTDSEILEAICSAVNGAEFQHLWAGGNGPDDSAGDLLVAQRLSSYTNGDVDRIKSMMSCCPRARRKYSDKHGAHGESFLDLIVDRAVKGTNWWWIVPVILQNSASARRTIRLALENAKTDPQILYKPEVLRALDWLKGNRPGEWEAQKAKIQETTGVSIQLLQRAMKTMKTQAADVQTTTSQELVSVASALPGTPSPDLVIPKGYIITESSTALLTTNQLGQQQIEVFAHAPVYIVERLTDDHLHYLKLGWYQDGRHHTLVVDRGVAMNQSKLQALASNGLPVTSFNSGALCRYLSDFEAVNRAILPVVRISAQLGWQGKNGRDGFLLGRCLILPNGEIAGTGDTEEDQATAAKAPGHIHFHPGSSGERQIADAIHGKGTLEGWLKAIEFLENFPKARLGIYISLVPPLLEILNAPNFVIDFAGVTTAGKTTTLKVAASNWGDPDQRSDLPFLQGWHVTKVFVERAISVLNFLPMILDDTKTVRFKEMVGEIIYQVVSGKGKGRGNVDGLSLTRSQKTVLISSGEAPSKEFTNDGGARMRCLEVMDSPFGEVSKEIGRLVTRLEAELFQNYGHSGPAFVQWLCRNRDLWHELKARYDQRTEDYTNAATSPQAGRLAKYAAAIDMSAYIIHQAVDMPWPYDDPLKDLWAEMSAGAAEAPPEIRALQAIEGWCYSNEISFYGRHEVAGQEMKPKVPMAGWTGFWDRPDDSNIPFFPDKLDSVLERLNFKPNEVKSGWRNRGWIETGASDKEKRLTVKRTYKLAGRNIKTNFTVIKRDAFRQVDELVGE
jgi:uncharacterized protein (DUF927 family)